MFSLSSLGLNPSSIKVLFISYFVLGLVSVLFCVLLYFLNAIGIYYLAKNSDHIFCWYSFVPFFRNLSVGKFASKDEKNRVGKLLFYLKLGAFVFFIISLIIGIVDAIDIVFKADDAIVGGYELEKSVISKLFIPMAFFAISAILSLIHIVVYYIALYKIYDAFANISAIVYIVLSIVFPVIVPFLVFSLRNNEHKSFSVSRDENGKDDYLL